MERVVITGLGVVSPIGIGKEALMKGLKEGKSGIDFIKSFDTEKHKVKIAAEVKDFDPTEFIDKKEAKRLDRFCQFAMAASKMAIEDSKLPLDTINKERFGVVIGSGIGGLLTTEKEDKILLEKGPGRVSPFTIPMIIGNMAAGNVAIKFGAKGMCHDIVTACASGTDSIGEAYRSIKHGYLDMAIAGGAEAAITPLALAGFASLTALSTSTDLNRASIPFDKDRDGFVMGEGAGIVILESLSHAKSRGAFIYGEIGGYGATCDAYHMTAPAKEGEGAARAMLQALNEGNIKPSEVSYINAHGTSTPYNDKFETQGIKSVFKEDSYKIPVSSTKSMTGHLLGAAGAVEAVICSLCFQEDFIPPTINLLNKDEECDLDYVPNKGRQGKLTNILSNSLGFGGHNGVLLFKRWSGGEEDEQ